jgi:hypothetical protein
MLVKVKNKANGNVQVITLKAYNLAKKRYQFIGNAPEGSDLDGQSAEVETKQVQQSEIQESPNLTTTARKEEEKGAEAVVGSAPKEKGKPGRKPKSENQISSPAPAVES